MILLVGLGNPGRRYEDTRHNAGFLVVDRLAERLGPVTWKEKFRGVHASAELGGNKLVLLKPQTFMNESGRSVQPAIAFFKVPLARVLVVHDELDLPFGTLRLKHGGGDAGHNGLRSIRQHLGSGEYTRLRVGVGKPSGDFRGADFVLQAFASADRADLDEVLDRAVEAVTLFVEKDLSEAMNVTNQRDKKKR